MISIRPYIDRLWSRARYLLRRFEEDRCSDNAAALTYMSLFALVPLLTVMYTIASAIPAFQDVELQIQDLLFQHLLPETSADLESYLEEFSRQAKKLTGFGVMFLIVTAVLMLRNIERSFNLIWRTRENRSHLSSFVIYWAVLSLAPLAIGLALGIPGAIAAAATQVEEYDPIGIGDLLLRITPLLLTACAFTLVYLALPNCRVPFRHALIGGSVAALAFNLARTVFANLVQGSSITLIYGAFAAVPLFLLWLYVSWNIVLMGAVLAHSLSAYQTSEQAAHPTVLKALDVLYLFWTRQRSGRPVRELEILNGRHKVLSSLDSETWRELRDIFVRRQLITQNNRSHYFLCRDLHSVTFWQIKEWVDLDLPLERDDITSELPWQHRAYNMLREERSTQRKLLRISLAELFEQ